MFIKKYLTVYCSFIFITFACQKINAQVPSKKYTVVLDAGHGGHDPGKVGYRGCKEKDIALSIVLKVGNLLRKHKNIRVVYTRKKDIFVNLWQRGKIANRAKADLFISVHCNAHKPKAVGAETWVLSEYGNQKNFAVAKAENQVILLEKNYQKQYKGFDPNSIENNMVLTLEQEQNTDASILFADLIQHYFTNKLKRVNRGVKQNYFIVLHQTYMPSVLIETGFLTNKNEANYLRSYRGQNSISKGIANSILKYFNQVSQNTVPIKTATPPKISTQKEGNFALQIVATKRKVTLRSYNFKGVKNVFRRYKNGIYKYYTCKSTTIESLQKCATKVREKYPDAFEVSLNEK